MEQKELLSRLKLKRTPAKIKGAISKALPLISVVENQGGNLDSIQIVMNNCIQIAVLGEDSYRELYFICDSENVWPVLRQDGIATSTEPYKCTEKDILDFLKWVNSPNPKLCESDIEKANMIEKHLQKQSAQFSSERTDCGVYFVLERPKNNEHVLSIKISVWRDGGEAEVKYNWSKEIPELHWKNFTLTGNPIPVINDMIELQNSTCKHCLQYKNKNQ